MRPFKAQYLHLGLLGVASVLAFGVWTRDDDAQLASRSNEVEVWGGSPESVTAVSFDSASRRVRLEPRQDAQGRWYAGSVEKDEPTSVSSTVDAGTPSPAGKHTSVRFVSVKAAEDLVKSLAPLHALRKVGRVEGSRAEEFGLDKPEGTLKLTVSGKPQTLVIGGATPGGSERYAKAASGEVFAIPGDLVQNLLFAEMRLPERELQGFKPEEATRVKLSKSGKRRELTRIPDKVEGWADSAAPGKLDETAGNWMTKLSRLHVQDWVEKPSVALGPDNEVVRVDYFAGSKALGSLELYRVPGEKGNEYLARSEYGRWPARVVTSAAEQVDQDTGSVLK